MDAGELATPIKVQVRPTVKTDKYGRGGGPWADLIEQTWARKKARAGGQVFQEARQQQRVPYEFLVRDDPDTRRIGPGNRILDLETNESFDVKASSPWEKDAAYRLVTAEAGGADG